MVEGIRSFRLTPVFRPHYNIYISVYLKATYSTLRSAVHSPIQDSRSGSEEVRWGVLDRSPCLSGSRELVCLNEF